jgi:hypothetical protein
MDDEGVSIRCLQAGDCASLSARHLVEALDHGEVRGVQPNPRHALQGPNEVCDHDLRVRERRPVSQATFEAKRPGEAVR